MPEACRNPAHVEILLLTCQRQLHAFDLRDFFRIAIGRHESNDVRIGSATVSNYHAEILNHGGRLLLRDLGSRNGTYLNSEKVRQRVLSPGDRIGIGTSLLTVDIELDSNLNDGNGLSPPMRADGVEVPSRGTLAPLSCEPADSPSSPVQEISLSDLLMRLCRNGVSVEVFLRNRDRQGRILVSGGRVLHAEAGAATAEKALFRLFGWDESRYEVRPLRTGSVLRTIS